MMPDEILRVQPNHSNPDACARKLPDDIIPFLKMCILSLDSSTLPSASMTPGRLRRAAGTSGELTAATLVRRRTSGGEVSRRLAVCPAVCRDGLPLSSIARCAVSRTGEEEERLRAESRHTSGLSSSCTATDPTASHPALRAGVSRSSNRGGDQDRGTFQGRSQRAVPDSFRLMLRHLSIM